MSTTGCSDKDRLLMECRRAAEAYTAAVAELSRRIGITSIADYLKLHEAADLARIRVNDSRDRLADHFAQHHCGMSDESIA